jgi:hypothetical protein
MPERLHLARTFGVSGWQEWRIDAGALVLAALAHCLRNPAASFTVRGLWRVAALWHKRFESVDPAALQLALCLPRTVTLANVNVRVTLLPARGRRAAGQFSLDLTRRPPRGCGLAPAPARSAWNVLRLVAGGEAEFAAMVAALLAAPGGTRLAVDVSADVHQAANATCEFLPLRAECRLNADESWTPLLRSLRLDVARLQTEKG